MIKERAWPVKAMYMLIAAALAISLIITAAPAHKVSAETIPDAKWVRVITPSEDEWVLAPNSTIIDFAIGDDGEVAYAIVEKWDADAAAVMPYLLKSTDHAATWDDITEGVEDELDTGDALIAGELLQVACDAEDPEFVAVALEATSVHVYISDDGGSTFDDTGVVSATLLPGDVYDLAISPEADGDRDLAIIGRDGGAGAIFRCQTTEGSGHGWEDATTYGTQWVACDAVVAVKFAPSWDADNTIMVVTVEDGAPDTVLLQSGTWGTVEGWNDDASVAFVAVNIIPAANAPQVDWTTLKGLTAGITTPLDYSGRYIDRRYVWVWVNYNHTTDGDIGQIFLVIDDLAEALGTKYGQVPNQPWLTNVSYLGYIDEGKAIAGVLGDGSGVGGLADCCEGVQVYRNDGIADMDMCCEGWTAACKPPTGRGAMAAVYVSDDPATSKAYAVALGGTEIYEEGAWSVSFDDGDAWNQISLIDTYIDYLSDVAVSPNCNKTMLVSVNLDHGECYCDSVWLHAEDLDEAEEYSGKWLRTWCDNLLGTNDDTIPGSSFAERGLLRLAPEEENGETVYLVDRMTDTVYWNELETLLCWFEGTSTVDDIVDLAVKDYETIYALGEDGSVAMSDDYAVDWDLEVDSEVDNGWTIALWGNYILVGGQASDVSYSDDGGETFTKMEDVTIANGYVTVAFDSYFDTNDTIYAALANAGASNGVYRCTIPECEKWTDLEAEPYDYTGLVLDRPAPGNPMTSADTGGVLYASYISGNLTGVARHLAPAEDIACKECADWDYLVEGLTSELFKMMPQALKICGCTDETTNSKLFAIDGSEPYDMEDAEDGTVWTFEDCYAKKAPTLESPDDGVTIAADPCACYNVPFTLMWERLCDACSYDIQIALDEEFTDVVYDSFVELGKSFVPSAGDAPSYHVGPETLTCEFTYYWRVRAADAATGQIIHSWWSEARSVMIAPSVGAGVNLIAPEDGATDVAVTDVGFSWSAVGSADKYDWKLSRNADLSAPITKTGLTTTATTYTGTALEYDTPYYWQVTAYKEGSPISASTIGTFRTMEEPPPPPDEEEIVTPYWVWVVIGIGAVLVIVVIVLIFRTRRV